MKKLVSLLLVGLMLIGGTGAVFAQESGNSNEILLLEEENERIGKFFVLKEFQNEIHKINELRKERLQLRIDIIDKHDAILDLYIEARENRDKEALEAAKEVRKELTVLNQEITDLSDQAKTERQRFREEAKNGNVDAAREHANNGIALLEAINDKVESKIEVLETIIEIFEDSSEATVEM